MTPAEELLAALKEHATADVGFEFAPRWPQLSVRSGALVVDVHIQSRTGRWCEDVYGPEGGTYEHDSASSAVYSAFLRARK